MSGTRDFVICRDGRIIPVPSGEYVHNLPVGEPVGVLALAAALVREPIPGVVLVHPAPGAERAVILLRRLRELPARVRGSLGVVPPANVLVNPDVAGLVELSDLYDASLILPVLEVLRGSARAVPVDREGRESGWDDAVAVRLLTRVQAADRESVLEAVRVVESGVAPSVQRWQEWSSLAAGDRDGFQVLPVTSGQFTGGTVPHAFGSYLTRYAPAGLPLTGMSLADVPQTVEGLRELVGGVLEPAPSFPDMSRVWLAPGAGVLVSFKQAASEPDGAAWLFAGADGRVELDPVVEDVISGAPADLEQWLAMVLADPSTRAMAVDSGAAPVSLASVLVQAEAPAESVVPTALGAGSTMFADSGWLPVPVHNDVIVGMARLDNPFENDLIVNVLRLPDGQLLDDAGDVDHHPELAGRSEQERQRLRDLIADPDITDLPPLAVSTAGPSPAAATATEADQQKRSGQDVVGAVTISALDEVKELLRGKIHGNTKYQTLKDLAQVSHARQELGNGRTLRLDQLGRLKDILERTGSLSAGTAAVAVSHAPTVPLVVPPGFGAGSDPGQQRAMQSDLGPLWAALMRSRAAEVAAVVALGSLDTDEKPEAEVEGILSLLVEHVHGFVFGAVPVPVDLAAAIRARLLAAEGRKMFDTPRSMRDLVNAHGRAQLDVASMRGDAQSLMDFAAGYGYDEMVADGLLLDSTNPSIPATYNLALAHWAAGKGERALELLKATSEAAERQYAGGRQQADHRRRGLRADSAGLSDRETELQRQKHSQAQRIARLKDYHRRLIEAENRRTPDVIVPAPIAVTPSTAEMSVGRESALVESPRPREVQDLLDRALSDQQEVEAELARIHNDIHTGSVQMEILNDPWVLLLDLKYHAGVVLRETGKPQEALNLLSAVYEDRVQVLGEEHPDTLTARYEIARTHLKLNDETNTDLNQAFDIISGLTYTRTRILGEDHPVTLETLHLLATVQATFGLPTKVVEVLRDGVLPERLGLLGAEHRDTAAARHDLGVAYLESHRAEEARQVLAEAAGTRARLLGADHIETLESHSAYGRALVRVGRSEQAIEVLTDIERAWERAPAKPGENDPLVLQVAADLIQAHRAAGQVEEAIDRLDRLIRVFTQAYGDVDERTLDLRRERVDVLTAAGQVDGAVVELESLREVRRSLHGEDDPQTISVGQKLGETYQAGSRDSEAMAAFRETGAAFLRQVKAPQELKLVLEHVNGLVAAHSSLAAMMHEIPEKTDGADAITLLSVDTVAPIEQAVGGGGLAYFAARHALALAHRKAGQLQTAGEILKEVSDRRSELLGPADAVTIVSRTALVEALVADGKVPEAVAEVRNLADALLAEDRYEEATALLRPFLENLERATVSDSLFAEILELRQGLGRAFLEAGQQELGLEQYALAVDRLATMLGNEASKTLFARRNLGVAYARAQRLNLATETLRQVLTDSDQLPTIPDAVLSAVSDLVDLYSMNGGDETAIVEVLRELHRRQLLELGETAHQTMDTTQRIAESLRRAGRLDEAIATLRDVVEPWFTRAQDSDSSTDGDDSTVYDTPKTVLGVMPLLGLSLAEAGRLDEAIEQWRAAATRYEKRGSLGKAESLLNRVLEREVEAFGEYHLRVADTRSDLAALLDKAGQVHTAVNQHERTVEAWTILKGATHPDTLTARWLMAQALIEANRHQDAVGHLEAVVLNWAADPEVSVRTVRRIHIALVDALKRAGREDEVVRALQNLIAAYRQADLTPRAVDLLKGRVDDAQSIGDMKLMGEVTAELVAIHVEAGAHHAAAESLAGLHAMQLRHLEPFDGRTLATAVARGKMLGRAGHPEDAVTVLQEAVATFAEWRHLRRTLSGDQGGRAIPGRRGVDLDRDALLLEAQDALTEARQDRDRLRTNSSSDGANSDLYVGMVTLDIGATQPFFAQSVNRLTSEAHEASAAGTASPDLSDARWSPPQEQEVPAEAHRMHAFVLTALRGFFAGGTVPVWSPGQVAHVMAQVKANSRWSTGQYADHLVWSRLSLAADGSRPESHSEHVLDDVADAGRTALGPTTDVTDVLVEYEAAVAAYKVLYQDARSDDPELLGLVHTRGAWSTALVSRERLWRAAAAVVKVTDEAPTGRERWIQDVFPAAIVGHRIGLPGGMRRSWGKRPTSGESSGRAARLSRFLNLGDRRHSTPVLDPDSLLPLLRDLAEAAEVDLLPAFTQWLQAAPTYGFEEAVAREAAAQWPDLLARAEAAGLTLHTVVQSMQERRDVGLPIAAFDTEIAAATAIQDGLAADISFNAALRGPGLIQAMRQGGIIDRAAVLGVPVNVWIDQAEAAGSLNTLRLRVMLAIGILEHTEMVGRELAALPAESFVELPVPSFDPLATVLRSLGERAVAWVFSGPVTSAERFATLRSFPFGLVWADRARNSGVRPVDQPPLPAEGAQVIVVDAEGMAMGPQSLSARLKRAAQLLGQLDSPGLQRRHPRTAVDTGPEAMSGSVAGSELAELEAVSPMWLSRHAGSPRSVQMSDEVIPVDASVQNAIRERVIAGALAAGFEPDLARTQFEEVFSPDFLAAPGSSTSVISVSGQARIEVYLERWVASGQADGPEAGFSVMVARQESNRGEPRLVSAAHVVAGPVSQPAAGQAWGLRPSSGWGSISSVGRGFLTSALRAPTVPLHRRNPEALHWRWQRLGGLDTTTSRMASEIVDVALTDRLPHGPLGGAPSRVDSNLGSNADGETGDQDQAGPSSRPGGPVTDDWFAGSALVDATFSQAELPDSLGRPLRPFLISVYERLARTLRSGLTGEGEFDGAALTASADPWNALPDHVKDFLGATAASVAPRLVEHLLASDTELAGIGKRLGQDLLTLPVSGGSVETGLTVGDQLAKALTGSPTRSLDVAGEYTGTAPTDEMVPEALGRLQRAAVALAREKIQIAQGIYRANLPPFNPLPLPGRSLEAQLRYVDEVQTILEDLRARIGELDRSAPAALIALAVEVSLLHWLADVKRQIASKADQTRRFVELRLVSPRDIPARQLPRAERELRTMITADPGSVRLSGPSGPVTFESWIDETRIILASGADVVARRRGMSSQAPPVNVVSAFERERRQLLADGVLPEGARLEPLFDDLELGLRSVLLHGEGITPALAGEIHRRIGVPVVLSRSSVVPVSGVTGAFTTRSSVDVRLVPTFFEVRSNADGSVHEYDTGSTTFPITTWNEALRSALEKRSIEDRIVVVEAGVEHEILIRQTAAGLHLSDGPLIASYHYLVSPNPELLTFSTTITSDSVCYQAVKQVLAQLPSWILIRLLSSNSGSHPEHSTLSPAAGSHTVLPDGTVEAVEWLWTVAGDAWRTAETRPLPVRAPLIRALPTDTWHTGLANWKVPPGLAGRVRRNSSGAMLLEDSESSGTRNWVLPVLPGYLVLGVDLNGSFDEIHRTVLDLVTSFPPRSLSGIAVFVADGMITEEIEALVDEIKRWTFITAVGALEGQPFDQPTTVRNWHFGTMKPAVEYDADQWESAVRRAGLKDGGPIREPTTGFRRALEYPVSPVSDRTSDEGPVVDIAALAARLRPMFLGLEARAGDEASGTPVRDDEALVRELVRLRGEPGLKARLEVYLDLPVQQAIVLARSEGRISALAADYATLVLSEPPPRPTPVSTGQLATSVAALRRILTGGPRESSGVDVARILLPYQHDLKQVWALADAYRVTIGGSLHEDVETAFKSSKYVDILRALLGTPNLLKTDVTITEAHELFRRLSALPLSFNYPDDGCYARAEAMVLALAGWGFSARAVRAKSSSLGIPTITAKGGTASTSVFAEWAQHIAPTMRVIDGDGYGQLTVFDPAVKGRFTDRPGPMALFTWLDQIGYPSRGARSNLMEMPDLVRQRVFEAGSAATGLRGKVSHVYVLDSYAREPTSAGSGWPHDLVDLERSVDSDSSKVSNWLNLQRGREAYRLVAAALEALGTTASAVDALTHVIASAPGRETMLSEDLDTSLIELFGQVGRSSRHSLSAEAFIERVRAAVLGRTSGQPVSNLVVPRDGSVTTTFSKMLSLPDPALSGPGLIAWLAEAAQSVKRADGSAVVWWDSGDPVLDTAVAQVVRAEAGQTVVMLPQAGAQLQVGGVRVDVDVLAAVLKVLGAQSGVPLDRVRLMTSLDPAQAAMFAVQVGGTVVADRSGTVYVDTKSGLAASFEVLPDERGVWRPALQHPSWMVTPAGEWQELPRQPLPVDAQWRTVLPPPPGDAVSTGQEMPGYRSDLPQKAIERAVGALDEAVGSRAAQVKLDLNAAAREWAQAMTVETFTEFITSRIGARQDVSENDLYVRNVTLDIPFEKGLAGGGPSALAEPAVSQSLTDLRAWVEMARGKDVADGGVRGVDCVTALEVFRDSRFGWILTKGVLTGGVQPGRVVDDLALPGATGGRRPWETFLPGASWVRVWDWDIAKAAVLKAGSDAVVFVFADTLASLRDPSGALTAGEGHAFAGVDVGEGKVEWLEAQGTHGTRLVDVPPVPPVGARMAVVTAQGIAVADPLADLEPEGGLVRSSPSDREALLDAPVSRTFADIGAAIKTAFFAADPGDWEGQAFIEAPALGLTIFFKVGEFQFAKSGRVYRPGGMPAWEELDTVENKLILEVVPRLGGRDEAPRGTSGWALDDYWTASRLATNTLQVLARLKAHANQGTPVGHILPAQEGFRYPLGRASENQLISYYQTGPDPMAALDLEYTSGELLEGLYDYLGWVSRESWNPVETEFVSLARIFATDVTASFVRKWTGAEVDPGKIDELMRAKEVASLRSFLALSAVQWSGLVGSTMGVSRSAESSMTVLALNDLKKIRTLLPGSVRDFLNANLVTISERYRDTLLSAPIMLPNGIYMSRYIEMMRLAPGDFVDPLNFRNTLGESSYSVRDYVLTALKNRPPVVVTQRMVVGAGTVLKDALDYGSSSTPGQGRVLVTLREFGSRFENQDAVLGRVAQLEGFSRAADAIAVAATPILENPLVKDTNAMLSMARKKKVVKPHEVAEISLGIWRQVQGVQGLQARGPLGTWKSVVELLPRGLAERIEAVREALDRQAHGEQPDDQPNPYPPSQGQPGGYQPGAYSAAPSTVPLEMVLGAISVADDKAVARLVDRLKAQLPEWDHLVQAMFADRFLPVQWNRFAAAVIDLDPAERTSVVSAISAFEFALMALREQWPQSWLPSTDEVVSAALGVEILSADDGQDAVQAHILRLPDGDMLYDAIELDTVPGLRNLVSQHRSVLHWAANEDEIYELTDWNNLPAEMLMAAIEGEEEAQDRPAENQRRRRPARPASELTDQEKRRRALAAEGRKRAEPRKALEGTSQEPSPEIQRRKAGRPEKLPRDPSTGLLTPAQLQEADAGQRFRERQRRKELGLPILKELQAAKGKGADSDRSPQERARLAKKRERSSREYARIKHKKQQLPPEELAEEFRVKQQRGPEAGIRALADFRSWLDSQRPAPGTSGNPAGFVTRLSAPREIPREAVSAALALGDLPNDDGTIGRPGRSGWEIRRGDVRAFLTREGLDPSLVNIETVKGRRVRRIELTELSFVVPALAPRATMQSQQSEFDQVTDEASLHPSAEVGPSFWDDALPTDHMDDVQLDVEGRQAPIHIDIRPVSSGGEVRVLGQKTSVGRRWAGSDVTVVVSPAAAGSDVHQVRIIHPSGLFVEKLVTIPAASLQFEASVQTRNAMYRQSGNTVTAAITAGLRPIYTITRPLLRDGRATVVPGVKTSRGKGWAPGSKVTVQVYPAAEGSELHPVRVTHRSGSFVDRPVTIPAALLAAALARAEEHRQATHAVNAAVTARQAPILTAVRKVTGIGEVTILGQRITVSKDMRGDSNTVAVTVTVQVYPAAAGMDVHPVRISHPNGSFVDRLVSIPAASLARAGVKQDRRLDPNPPSQSSMPAGLEGMTSLAMGAPAPHAGPSGPAAVLSYPYDESLVADEENPVSEDHEYLPTSGGEDSHWQLEDYDLDVFLVNLPAGQPRSARAVSKLLAGVPGPQLGLLADQLRVKLSAVRDAAVSRLGAEAAGKELWGLLDGRTDDGRVLDSPRRASADSLREQMAQMVAGYDYTRLQISKIAAWSAGAPELQKLLPPVGVLVADLLSAKPATGRPVSGEVSTVLPTVDADGRKVSPYRLVPAPEGVKWEGRVLPLGVVSRPRLKEAVRWADGMLRPVILVGTPDNQADAQQLVDDLERVLRWFAYEGVQPVVQVLDRTALDGLREMFKPVVIERTTVGMDDRWALYGPDGVLVTKVSAVTRGLFIRADRLPAVSTGFELTAVLSDWLALTDPVAIERYLREHLGDLSSAQAVERVGQMPVEDAGVHRTVLNLVLRNGGPADPEAARFVPATNASRSEIASLSLTGAVRETFAVDYLSPQRSLDKRKEWNDQLIRLVDLRFPEEIARTGVKRLTVEEMLVLATNTHDEIPDTLDANFSRGMATVFTGLAQALLMSQETAEKLSPDTKEWKDLVMPIATCDLSPAARQIVIYQFDVIRDRLLDVGRVVHAALVGLVTDAIGMCL